MDIRREKLELIARLTTIEDANLIHRIKQLLDQGLAEELFETTEKDLVGRSKAPLQSIVEGRTRDIRDFQNEINAWKKNQSIK
ncbi:MAG: hypothetical protein WD431_17920 [Cyclobacteriaceae bacterium]